MSDNAISITNLCKRYDSGVQALTNINIDIKKGDFFALLGPNGAGKSTTIGIISSLVRKTSGSVAIHGYDIDASPELAKLKLGIVPQEFNFNNFEKVSNILLFQAGYYGISGTVADKRIEKYLRLLGLWDKRSAMAISLSGGMKRRLMIARAMVHEPEILILDEPTAGVDITLRRTLWEVMKPINARGTTIILTTHYLEEAEAMCRNVAIIDKGEVIHNTSIKNLLSKLDKQTLVFDLADKVAADFTLQNYPVTVIDAQTIEVILSRNETINQVMAELTKNKVSVVSMRNKSNRLEEVFLNLTK